MKDFTFTVTAISFNVDDQIKMLINLKRCQLGLPNKKKSFTYLLSYFYNFCLEFYENCYCVEKDKSGETIKVII